MKKREGLSLTRMPHQVIMIGDDIEITYEERVGGNEIRLNIKAPPDMRIMRKELVREQVVSS